MTKFTAEGKQHEIRPAAGDVGKMESVSFVNDRPVGKLSGIHPACRFYSILEYERIRSIRSGKPLSLVVFETDGLNLKSAQNRRLERILAKRIRSTDQAGRLDSRHIGIILPYTSESGAKRLVESISPLMSGGAVMPKYSIYTHPFNWLFDGKTGESSRDNRNSAENQYAFANSLLPAWKRAMDIAGALLGLILLSPVMLLIIILIKIVSPGPVFFRQQRIGYMGKPFTMWKFRTMKLNNNTASHQQYLAELINGNAQNGCTAKPMTKLDDRLQLIPFGKILRQSCIDELPQLLNVLRGEMTLVGPRPPIPYEYREYQPWHRERIDAVPGMTGLWQVSGKNRLTFDKMVCLDVQYWRQKSFWLDLKILLLTPAAIFLQIKDGMHNKKLQRKGDDKND